MVGDEAGDRETPRTDRDDERPGDGQRCEHPPVRDAIRAQRAVFDERRPRVRPARDGESRDARQPARSASSSRSSESASHSASTTTAPTTPARDWVRSSARTAP